MENDDVWICVEVMTTMTTKHMFCICFRNKIIIHYLEYYFIPDDTMWSDLRRLLPQYDYGNNIKRRTYIPEIWITNILYYYFGGYDDDKFDSHCAEDPDTIFDIFESFFKFNHKIKINRIGAFGDHKYELIENCPLNEKISNILWNYFQDKISQT